MVEEEISEEEISEEEAGSEEAGSEEVGSEEAGSEEAGSEEEKVSITPLLLSLPSALASARPFLVCITVSIR